MERQVQAIHQLCQTTGIFTTGTLCRQEEEMRYREIVEACWKGYVKKGMKPKGDKIVPNCVPVRELEEDLRKWFKEK